MSRSSSSTLLPSGVANDGQHYPALPFDAVEGVDQERPGAPIAVAVFQLSSTPTPRAPGLDHWLMISMWQALVNLTLFMMLGEKAQCVCARTIPGSFSDLAPKLAHPH